MWCDLIHALSGILPLEHTTEALVLGLSGVFLAVI